MTKYCGRKIDRQLVVCESICIELQKENCYSKGISKWLMNTAMCSITFSFKEHRMWLNSQKHTVKMVRVEKQLRDFH